jgi:predicted DNA-binding antitoxin AbrB/MazE fold protein
MTHEFHAIYENGVLRPLTPLNLPELAEVAVTLHEANGADTPSPAELQQQQAALDAMFRDVDQLPQRSRGDGLSGRDHDQILYGSAKGFSSIQAPGLHDTSPTILTTQRRQIGLQTFQID